MGLSPEWRETFEVNGFEAKHWSEIGTIGDKSTPSWARTAGLSFVDLQHLAGTAFLKRKGYEPRRPRGEGAPEQRLNRDECLYEIRGDDLRAPLNHSIVLFDRQHGLVNAQVVVLLDLLRKQVSKVRIPEERFHFFHFSTSDSSALAPTAEWLQLKNGPTGGIAVRTVEER